ncbi:hypothetical protein BXZ70DRAFT_906997 [Cristinia sonorae]|uniref:Uncharacterized protein n=1 Tax=Cristinia sonorae TaxID=1940300 RepID=A0A8K0UP04_9AGAR|nr:hypothetical protein BXZ70DRAFT_906997 [Cristinia sonorae]
MRLLQLASTLAMATCLILAARVKRVDNIAGYNCDGDDDFCYGSESRITGYYCEDGNGACHSNLGLPCYDLSDGSRWNQVPDFGDRCLRAFASAGHILVCEVPCPHEDEGYEG